MRRIKGKLQPNHLIACRMKVEGAKTPDIAKVLGVQERTLHLWFSDDQIKAEITRLLDKVDDIFAEKMASYGLMAMDALAAMVQKDDREPDISDGTKLAAIREILDRQERTALIRDRMAPKGHGGGDGDTTNILQIVGNMSDDELLEIARQRALPPGETSGVDSTAVPA